MSSTDAVDVIEAFEFRFLTSEQGVEKVAGFCPRRVVSEEAEEEGYVEDPAWRITSGETIPHKKIIEVFKGE